MKKILLGSLCLAASFFATGQSQTQGFDHIIPPSPTAASLGQYGDISVGFYSGTANINIPIYTIIDGDIKIPISLQGSARSLTVSEVPGWVGAGFSLQAGGVITRSVAGLPDDLYVYGFLHNLSVVDTINNQLNRDTLLPTQFDQITDNLADIQPDIFSYSINGYSGRFFFDSLGAVHCLSYDNCKFSYHFSDASDAYHNLPGYIDQWTVITPDGFVYTFEDLEWSTDNSNYANTVTKAFHVSAWYLSNIQSPAGHTVSFVYGSANRLKPRLTESQFQRTGFWSCYYSPVGGAFGSNYAAPSLSYTETIHLASIVTSKGTSVLFKSSKRNDLYQQYTVATISPGCSDPASCQEDFKLDTLEVHDPDGLIVDRHVFNYNETPSERLQLLSVVEPGKPPYTFEYNGSIPVTYSSMAIDHWGYYNGATSNTSLIPTTTVNIPAMGINSSFGSANRDISTTNTKIGVLTKVTYPTGGSSEFEYEQNEYSYFNSTSLGVDKAVGGLRIKKITSHDGATNLDIVKEYEYSDSGSSTGVIGSEPEYLIHLTNLSVDYGCHDVFWLQSAPVNTMSYTFGSAIGYFKVKEKLSNGSYTIYNYSSFKEYPDELPVYSYPFNPVSIDGNGMLQMAPKTSMDHLRGQLLSVRNYSPSGQLLHSVESEYVIQDSNAYYQKFYSYTPVDKPQNYGGASPLIFPIIMGYNQKSNWVTKKQDTESTIDTTSGLPITVTRHYYYDNPRNIQLSRICYVDSKGDSVEEYSKFPGDILESPAPTTPQQSAINALATANAFLTPLEQGVKVNHNYVTRTRNNYKEFSTGAFPLYYNTESENGNGGFKLQKTVYSYDPFQNVQQGASKDGIYHRYLWDYNATYPVMDLVGSSSEDFAYSGFEGSNKGNWTYQDTAVRRDFFAVLGNKVLKLSSGDLSTSGLSTAKTYLLDIWQRGTSLSLGGSALIYSFSKNGWIFRRFRISGVSSVTISGDGVVDEARLYPETAQMTSYAYQPLVGMIGTNDANNRTSYAEYDSVGRLLFLRDQDKRITKVYCYSYQGQSQNCNLLYYNSPDSAIFHRSNCSLDKVPGSIQYVVPERRYFSFISQADADAQAHRDIQQYGQQLADDSAECSDLVIYAKLMYENFVGDYFDVVVRFYYDIDCTIPAYVDNLTVNWDASDFNSQCGCVTHNPQSAEASGEYLYITSSYFEELINGGADYVDHFFDLLPGTGYQNL